jgi:SAM-dependent methyltransferase
MLNWAARYYPILRALGPSFAEHDSLLEIGAGPFGIGRYRRFSFVGCDLNFPCHPGPPMLPLLASATALPFMDRSFDGVVLSDVLEHIPPDQRTYVIAEALRVTRKIAIFGFPSGGAAFEYDLKLAEHYDRGQQERPEWLKEHLRFQPFPTFRLFDTINHGWSVTCFQNENVAFHNWVMRQEMHRPRIYFFQILLAVIPKVMEFLLRKADKAPCYREIVVVRRSDIGPAPTVDG